MAIGARSLGMNPVVTAHESLDRNLSFEEYSNPRNVAIKLKMFTAYNHLT